MTIDFTTAVTSLMINVEQSILISRSYQVQQITQQE